MHHLIGQLDQHILWCTTWLVHLTSIFSDTPPDWSTWPAYSDTPPDWSTWPAYSLIHHLIGPLDQHILWYTTSLVHLTSILSDTPPHWSTWPAYSLIHHLIGPLDQHILWYTTWLVNLTSTFSDTPPDWSTWPAYSLIHHLKSQHKGAGIFIFVTSAECVHRRSKTVIAVYSVCHMWRLNEYCIRLVGK
jgi:hypothetical protein